jgi:hypothetical protein
MILVTRDEDNTQITGREHRITDTQRDLARGPVFTDPGSSVCHVDFSSILSAFKESGNEEILKAKLYELFEQ